ncbi:MAG: ChaN family lipoprotein, partial [Pseudomonadota bacterium]
MRKAPLAALAFLIGFGAPATGAEMSVADAIGAARGHDVVIVGEVHDNPQHHAVQADFARALQPGAVVLEMILAEHGPMLTEMRADGEDRAAQAAALGWEGSGWPAYSYYAGVLDAAGDAPLFGALMPRGDVRRAFEVGAAEVFGPEAARFGLTKALGPEEQAAREALQFAAHCEAMPAPPARALSSAQIARPRGQRLP